MADNYVALNLDGNVQSSHYDAVQTILKDSLLEFIATANKRLHPLGLRLRDGGNRLQVKVEPNDPSPLGMGDVVNALVDGKFRTMSRHDYDGFAGLQGEGIIWMGPDGPWFYIGDKTPDFIVLKAVKSDEEGVEERHLGTLSIRRVSRE